MGGKEEVDLPSLEDALKAVHEFDPYGDPWMGDKAPSLEFFQQNLVGGAVEGTSSPVTDSVVPDSEKNELPFETQTEAPERNEEGQDEGQPVLTFKKHSTRRKKQRMSQADIKVNGSELQPDEFPPHGQTVRMVPLQRVAAYVSLHSGTMGLPTVVVATPKLLLLGTSRGHVLAFDYQQQLRGTLGGDEVGAHLGACTALDVQPEGDIVAAGYAQGTIVLWDWTTKRKLKVLKDVYADSSQVRTRPSSISATPRSGSPTPSIQYINRSTPSGSPIPRKSTHSPAGSIVSLPMSPTSVSSFGSVRLTQGHGSPVWQLSFVDANTLVSLGGRRPSVHLHSISYLMLMMRIDSTCMLGHAHGGPQTLASLPTLPDGGDSPNSRHLVAMALMDRLVIAAVKPQMCIVHTVARGRIEDVTDSPHVLPSLAWLHPPAAKRSTGKEKKSIPPTPSSAWLAFSWGPMLHVMEVRVSSEVSGPKGSLVFDHVTSIPFKVPAAAVRWLTKHLVCVIDMHEHLVVVEPRQGTVLEVIDLGPMELACRERDTEQWAYQPYREYAGSVFSNRTQIYLLGLKSLRVVEALSWSERLASLVRSGRTVKALEIGWQMKNGMCPGAVRLHRDPSQRAAVVGAHMADLLMAYLTHALESAPKGDTPVSAVRHYSTVAHTCLEYGTRLGCVDLLFGDMYSKISTVEVLRQAFLLQLSDYVMENKVTSLPPTVMKDFVTYFEEGHMAARLQDCLLHVDMTTIDLDQAVHLFRSAGLHEGLIYLYNKGLRDYATPVLEHIDMIREMQQGSQSQPQRAKDLDAALSRLFTYLQCCLTGNAFPRGRLSTEDAQMVKSQVYTLLIDRGHSLTTPPGCSYPNLRALLSFDPNRTFQVLCDAFDDPALDGPQHPPTPPQQNPTTNNNVSMPSIHSKLSGKRKRQSAKSGGLEEVVAEIEGARGEGMRAYEMGLRHPVPDRQLLVDILVDVVKDMQGNTAVAHAFYVFLALELAKRPDTITVTPQVLNQMVESLTIEGCIDSREGREAAMLALWSARFLKVYAEDDLLRLAHRAHFYRMCELLYRRRHDLPNVLQCYLDDPARKGRVFEALEEMVGPHTGQPIPPTVQKFCTENLGPLLQIDPKLCAATVLGPVDVGLPIAVGALEGDPDALYLFLSAVFDISRAKTGPSFAEEYPDIHERYLEYMCVRSPSSVLGYLRASKGYRLESCLGICRRYQVEEAVPWLMEMMGDVMGALGLILKTLRKRAALLMRLATDGRQAPENITDAEGSVKAMLGQAVELCQRSARRVNKQEMEGMWTSVLDTIMDAARQLKSIHTDHDVESVRVLLGGLGQEVVRGMMGHVAMATVLERLVRDPAPGADRFGDVRPVVLSILDTFQYEEVLLSTVNRIIGSDHHQAAHQLSKDIRRGMTLRHDVCQVCGQILGAGHNAHVRDEGDAASAMLLSSVVVFSCGHGYHARCLQQVGKVGCTVCNASAATKKTHHTTKGKEPAVGEGSADGEEGPESVTKVLEERVHQQQAATSTSGPDLLARLSAYSQSARTPSRSAVLDKLQTVSEGRRSGRRSKALVLAEGDGSLLKLAPPTPKNIERVNPDLRVSARMPPPKVVNRIDADLWRGYYP